MSEPTLTPAQRAEIEHERAIAAQMKALVAQATDIYVRNGLHWGDGTPWGFVERCAFLHVEEHYPDLFARLTQPIPSRTPTRRKMSGTTRGRVLQRDGDACQRCGTSEDLAIDHIVPVSKGGTDDLDNLQVLCRPCNSSKGNR